MIDHWIALVLHLERIPYGGYARNWRCGRPYIDRMACERIAYL